VLTVRAPESRLWGSGWRFSDRFALFVKLTHGPDEGTKHNRHSGPVAFGKRFQQLILVLSEANPQNPVFFVQISLPLGSGLLVGEPPDQAVKSCGGQTFTVERKYEDFEPESWWAGIGLDSRLELSTKQS